MEELTVGIVLKTVQAEKSYGKGELETKALKPTDIEIEQGVFHAIIGKSGSGKSTLLHILGGLDKPTGGKVYLEGESMFDLKEKDLAVLRRRRIGFVFQAFNLLSEHTVLENILMPVHLDKRGEDREYLEKILKSLEITDKLPYYPDELSGGERQRVAIARALATKPAIILADEPTGNLDENTGKEVIRLLKQSAKEFGQTVILVTHDMEIAGNADRVITISNGSIASVV